MRFVPLAASPQNKCTSLVCSCYAPTRNSRNNNYTNNNGVNNNRSNFTTDSSARHSERLREKVKFSHGLDDKHESLSCHKSPGTCTTNLPLKSNLKKATTVDQVEMRTGSRKVNWPDAHGKDIAHVQQIESSTNGLEDGKLEGLTNSCTCAIQ
ncbi:hypothetical protein IFM89_024997 [Coptis chinensis]|uniref:Uncharacterized protein n=1 Tax=Coptis chinensis TaxID=261450 RepID=A0A835HW69_9MAGN|nr:hypothetical protein IFM89_024997 [Coptis chinensis]